MVKVIVSCVASNDGQGYLNQRKPFKRQPRKMVKHTQTIRRVLPTNVLSLFDHFVGLALKGLQSKRLVWFNV